MRMFPLRSISNAIVVILDDCRDVGISSNLGVSIGDVGDVGSDGKRRKER